MGRDGSARGRARSNGGGDGRDAGPGTVAGLVSELSELTELILDTDSLDTVVWEAAMLAVHAADAVAACGVTVLRDGTMLSIRPDVASFGSLEDLQYEHMAGPILSAMEGRRTVVVTAADARAQWPRYADLARELGVVSTLVVPLTVGDEVLGALSLYATTDGADLDEARVLGELVADLASTALSCMARHAEKVKLTEELRTAISSRAVIEQAKGALMATRGIDADGAFALLRRSSQNRNVKLRDVAGIVADTLAGTARPS